MTMIQLESSTGLSVVRTATPDPAVSQAAVASTPLVITLPSWLGRWSVLGLVVVAHLLVMSLKTNLYAAMMSSRAQTGDPSSETTTTSSEDTSPLVKVRERHARRPRTQPSATPHTTLSGFDAGREEALLVPSSILLEPRMVEGAAGAPVELPPVPHHLSVRGGRHAPLVLHKGNEPSQDAVADVLLIREGVLYVRPSSETRCHDDENDSSCKAVGRVSDLGSPADPSASVLNLGEPAPACIALFDSVIDDLHDDASVAAVKAGDPCAILTISTHERHRSLMPPAGSASKARLVLAARIAMRTAQALGPSIRGEDVAALLPGSTRLAHIATDARTRDGFHSGTGSFSRSTLEKADVLIIRCLDGTSAAFNCGEVRQCVESALPHRLVDAVSGRKAPTNVCHLVASEPATSEVSRFCVFRHMDRPFFEGRRPPAFLATPTVALTARDGHVEAHSSCPLFATPRLPRPLQ